MIPLTDGESKSYEKQKVCHICKKGFNTDDDDDDDNDDNNDGDNKKYHKEKDHFHYTGKFRGAAHSICNLRFKTPKEIPILFHNDSAYDYHFIINQLAKEFDGQLECLGENTEKCITFSVPISKELDNGKTITNKLKFIDSFRFMDTSISNLLIPYLKFTKKNVKDARKEEKSNQYAILLGLKIINYIINAKNAKKDG